MTAGADGEGHEALLNGVGQGEDGNDAADLPASDGEVMPSAATHAAEGKNYRRTAWRNSLNIIYRITHNCHVYDLN